MTPIVFKLIGFIGWLTTLVLGIAGSWFWNFTETDPDDNARKKLTVSGRRAVYVMVVAVLFAVVATGYGEYASYQASRLADIEKARLNVFTHSGLAQIDEASGASYDPKTKAAYIVDDDRPSIFKFEFNKNENKYQYIAELPLIALSGKKYEGSNLEDLEAMALYQDKLYAVTSHSNKTTGEEKLKRQLLLEVDISDGKFGTVTRETNLRKAIFDRFKQPIGGRNGPLVSAYRDEEERLEVMNIEGLAISKKGRVYFGFRTPFIDGTHALVLTANLDELFDNDAILDVVLLELLHEGKHYAITDLAFDKNGQDILVMGNSRKRLEYFPPGLWQWTPQPEQGVQQVKLLSIGFMKPPELFRAKPEALIVSSEDHIGIFADAEGYGGQQVYKRVALGLEEVDDE